MLPGIGIQAPHRHEETLDRKFVAGPFFVGYSIQRRAHGRRAKHIGSTRNHRNQGFNRRYTGHSGHRRRQGENRLEKSFDDSAKECEKPADTFPRDHPKAVPKRPNNKTNRRGAHGRRSRVHDQNMRRTDSTRRAGNGGQRVASFCSSAAAFLSPCAVIAASATSRDRASTPVSATPRAADRPPADPRIAHRRNITKPIHQH